MIHPGRLCSPSITCEAGFRFLGRRGAARRWLPALGTACIVVSAVLLKRCFGCLRHRRVSAKGSVSRGVSSGLLTRFDTPVMTALQAGATMKFQTVLLVVLFCILLSTGIGAPQEVAKPALAGRPKLGLVLEGGGALGLAHIGVLQWMEEHRIPVSYVAGTSMGGLVGGIYATVQISRGGKGNRKRDRLGRGIERPDTIPGSVVSTQTRRS